MKILIIFSLFINAVFAMGDPDFVPANPADSNISPPVENMMDTTSTLNQTDQNKDRQQQQVDEQDEYVEEHRYDEPRREESKEDL